MVLKLYKTKETDTEAKPKPAEKCIAHVTFIPS